MKRILSSLSILSVTLLFIGCSSDTNNEDAALFQEVQGKWKLTELFSDDSETNIPVINGYEIELKSDHTFTSDEVEGYTGGTYTVITNPGKNLRLVFKNNSGNKVLYKYISGTNDNVFYSQPAIEDALPDDIAFFTGDILTKIP